jgi:hypothetical protein
MRKKYWLYILLIFLLAAAVFTIFNRKAGTYRENENRFAIRDTGTVKRIEIMSEHKAVTLERMQGKWVVNNKYPAASRKIATLLMVLSRLQVSAPVPAAVKEEIINRLKEEGKRVEVITDSRNHRVILMYQDTVYTGSACMMLENSDEPFRVEIPGYPGKKLTGLFVDEAGFWRDNSIFRLREDEIISVAVYDRARPGKSFYLVKNDDSGFKLFNYPDSTEIPDFNPGQVRQYLSYFASVPFERYLSVQEKQGQPDLDGSKPDHIVTVRASGNIVIRVETFPWYVSGHGAGPEPDLDRLIAVINDTDTVAARYVDLDPVIKDIGYFLEKEKNNLYN